MDDSPNPVLDRYIQWFNRHGPGPHAAHRGLRAEMMLAAGMYPGFLLEEDWCFPRTIPGTGVFFDCGSPLCIHTISYICSRSLGYFTCSRKVLIYLYYIFILNRIWFIPSRLLLDLLSFPWSKSNLPPDWFPSAFSTAHWAVWQSPTGGNASSVAHGGRTDTMWFLNILKLMTVDSQVLIWKKASTLQSKKQGTWNKGNGYPCLVMMGRDGRIPHLERMLFLFSTWNKMKSTLHQLDANTPLPTKKQKR